MMVTKNAIEIARTKFMLKPAKEMLSIPPPLYAGWKKIGAWIQIFPSACS
jgi:hypothetical protein